MEREELRQEGGGGQGSSQEHAYILHSGVGLHDVFLHLVSIFLQAFYELGQLFAGDAGEEKGEKEGDPSPHKHGHSPNPLPGLPSGCRDPGGGRGPAEPARHCSCA